MRLAILFALGTMAQAAHADPGHVAEAGGHDHWLAVGAFGAAIAIVVLAALRGRNRKDDPAEKAATDRDPERQEG